MLERMLCGVSTRRFPPTQEPVGSEVEAEARSVSKSAVSREFVARTRENLEALMARRLDDVRLAVLMVDGISLKERTNVVALGITTDGMKIPLGRWEGSTENAAVATALLADLVGRGLDVEQRVLCVFDGAKALRRPVRDVLGVDTRVQRCVRHQERGVLEHLSERDRPAVKRRLRRAWPTPTTTERSSSSACWPRSSTARTPARRPRCARGWRRRSPSPASGSAAA